MNNTEAYLSLLEKVLTDYYRCGHEEYRPITWGKPNWRKQIFFLLEKILRLKGYSICKRLIPDSKKRLVGADWPFGADTMIGLKRLQNIRFCLEDTIRKQMDGDLIETGGWRGGATIYMRALLKAYGITNKKVWVADSFEGLPKPNSKKYAEDEGDRHFEEKLLSISLDEVKGNFAKYDLLDDQGVFLKGWFRTRCQLRRSSDCRSCVWMATCTSLRLTRWLTCIRNFHRVATLSLMIGVP